MQIARIWLDTKLLAICQAMQRELPLQALAEVSTALQDKNEMIATYRNNVLWHVQRNVQRNVQLSHFHIFSLAQMTLSAVRKPQQLHS